jgi:hypothetical protein
VLLVDDGCVAGGADLAVPGSIVAPVCEAWRSPHGFPSFHVIDPLSPLDLHPTPSKHAIDRGARVSINKRRI